MSSDSGRLGPSGAARRSAIRVPLAALLGLMTLSGCAQLRGGQLGTAAVPPAEAPVPTDPLLAFASRANPGDQDRLVLGDGRTARVRLLRAYHSAGGRECREVLVASGMGDRTGLVCNAGAAGWVEARPLLRGGGAPRP